MSEPMHNLEQFNSEKSLLRMTTDRVPNTNALQKEIGIPLGVIVKPFGEQSTVWFSIPYHLGGRNAHC